MLADSLPLGKNQQLSLELGDEGALGSWLHLSGLELHSELFY